MTTDPEEGRRQIESMTPHLKVGDEVRLKAGGNRVMHILSFEDYGNMAVVEWKEDDIVYDDRLPVSSLDLLK